MFICGGFNCIPPRSNKCWPGSMASPNRLSSGFLDERLGEVGKAFLVLRPGTQLDREDGNHLRA